MSNHPYYWVTKLPNGNPTCSLVPNHSRFRGKRMHDWVMFAFESDRAAEADAKAFLSDKVSDAAVRILDVRDHPKIQMALIATVLSAILKNPVKDSAGVLKFMDQLLATTPVTTPGLWPSDRLVSSDTSVRLCHESVSDWVRLENGDPSFKDLVSKPPAHLAELVTWLSDGQKRGEYYPWHWIAKVPDGRFMISMALNMDSGTCQKYGHAFSLGVYSTEKLALDTGLKRMAHIPGAEVRAFDIRFGTGEQLAIVLMGLTTAMNLAHEGAGDDALTGYLNKIPVMLEPDVSFDEKAGYHLCNGYVHGPSISDWMAQNVGGIVAFGRCNLASWLGIKLPAISVESKPVPETVPAEVNSKDQPVPVPTTWPIAMRQPWARILTHMNGYPKFMDTLLADIFSMSKDMGGALLGTPAMCGEAVKRAGMGLTSTAIAMSVRDAEEEMATIVAFLTHGKVVLKPDPLLVESLIHTDLPVPMKHIWAPYRALYIDISNSPIPGIEKDTHVLGYYATTYPIPKHRELKLYRAPSGLWLEGAIFDNTASMESKSLAELGVSNMLVVVTNVCHPGGRAVPAMMHPTLYLGDWLCEDFIAETVAGAGIWAYGKEHHEGPLIEFVKDNLRLVAGLFLYMSDPDLRKYVEPRMYGRHDEALRGFKKDKLNDAGFALVRGDKFSVIKVHPTTTMRRNDVEAQSGGYSVKPHWRRGHRHLYWTGPGRTVPKYHNLEAMKVRKDLVPNGKTLPKKKYVVEKK